MSSKFAVRFPMQALGSISLTIKDQTYEIKVDINTHGVRFSTQLTFLDELNNYRHRMLYFTEGGYLGFPDVDEAIMVELEGDEEDVDKFWKEYNRVLFGMMPKFLTDPDWNVGFIKQEYERLQLEDGPM